MASKRGLKKDVKHFFGDFVDQCIFQRIFFNKDFEALEKLVDEAVEIEEGLLVRISANKKNREEFQAVRNDLKAAAEKLVDSLNKI